MSYSIFFYLIKLFEHSKYMIIFKLEIFGILIVLQIAKFWKCANFEIQQFQKFYYFMNLWIMEIWQFSKF